jgi:hypothetical protein
MNFSFIPARFNRKNYEKVVFLAGSGRSGTTWLDELINYRGDFRVLFEPFHNTYVPEWAGYHLRHYLRGDEQDADLKKAMNAILSGKISNKWVDKKAVPKGLKKLLIKDIRANLMLRWIRNNYPGIPMVLLLRHPGAVIHSKIKLNWGVHLEDLTSQEKAVGDHLRPFLDLLTNPETPVFRKHVLMWCVENYIPLRQFKPGEIHVVFYEELILKPRETLMSLFSFIEEPFHEGVMELHEKPSRMARPHSAILSGNGNLLLNWKEGLTQEEQEMIPETLKLFNLDLIYGEDGLPVPGNLHKIV